MDGSGFNQFAERMQRLGDGRLLDAAERGLEESVPTLVAAPARGVSRLPRTGGLAAQVARTKVTAEVSRLAGVRLQVNGEPGAVVDPGAINRGRVRHLTWGRKPWHVQLVPPGWFSDPLTQEAPGVRARIVRHVGEEIRRA
jgi:hypothetical protein